MQKRFGAEGGGEAANPALSTNFAVGKNPQSQSLTTTLEHSKVRKSSRGMPSFRARLRVIEIQTD
jgi:hypothetical protein